MSLSAEDIEKKLNKLKKGSSPDKLTYEALILLLQHDQTLRQLIRNVVERNSDADKSAIDDAELDAEHGQEEQIETLSSQSDGDIHSDVNFIMKSVIVESGAEENSQHLPIAPDIKESLRAELSSALRLLELVESHVSLKTYLLESCGSEGERLMKLLVNLGSWVQIEMIWDTLAADVKQREQSATADEQEILEGCLQCFNLSNSQFKAAVDQPKLPQDFNHKVHNRLNAKGKVVTAIALPGLIDSAGDIVRKVLVITE